MKKTQLTVAGLLFTALLAAQVPSWKYIQVDDKRGKWGDFDKPEFLRYFGLAMVDLNHDGYRDILAGRYIYFNPGGDLTGNWERTDLGMNVDGMLITDVDGDEYPDIIAEALPNVWWLEADDTRGLSWKGRIMGSIPPTDHINGQGYKLADIVAGGKPEILLSGHGGVYACQIPDQPGTTSWNFKCIAESGSEEGIGVGDIDGDGDIDLATDTSPMANPIPWN